MKIEQIEKIGKRIKDGLAYNNMKASTLSKKTGISSSMISEYIHNKYEPKQNNIYKIAKVLDVNEVWLMGLDAPMARDAFKRGDAWTDEKLKATEEDIQSVGDIDLDKLKRMLHIKPFTNVREALLFVIEYDLKMVETKGISSWSDEKILKYVNASLHNAQELTKSMGIK